MSLTALQILFGCLTIVIVLTFILKRAPDILVYGELALIAAYEICFLIFHPLIAIVFIISFSVLVFIFYLEDEKFKAMPNWQIYITLGFFVLAVILEAIETFAGRLF
ncbi:MAG: hypothetical protein IKI57_00710 [Clostridia bacterium]|nr:hypothetical protein [Clostridia bacterium]